MDNTTDTSAATETSTPRFTTRSIQTMVEPRRAAEGMEQAADNMRQIRGLLGELIAELVSDPAKRELAEHALLELVYLEQAIEPARVFCADALCTAEHTH